MDNEFIALIAESLKIDATGLTEASTVETVPEWDSLSHWTVITRLEDRYNIEFTMEEAIEFKDLGDIYATIMSKLEKSQNN